MTPDDKKWFEDLNDDPNDGVLSAAKLRKLIKKLREENDTPQWIDPDTFFGPSIFTGFVGFYSGKEEMSVCTMCRAALHHKCEGNCACICARGY